jgi:ABC-type phosphate transport system substrate-binding protein
MKPLSISSLRATSPARAFLLMPAIGVLLLLCSLMAGVANAADVVITHPANANSTLPLSSVRAIFSMRLNTWPDGTQVTVFVLPDRHPAHARFSRTILKMLPYRLRREWDRLVFSGTGIAPIEVKDEAEMRRRVASTPGSIGYLDEGLVDENVRALVVR